MRHSRRRPLHKKASARNFSRQTRRTKKANMRATPMRGGWRL